MTKSAITLLEEEAKLINDKIENLNSTLGSLSSELKDLQFNKGKLIDENSLLDTDIINKKKQIQDLIDIENSSINSLKKQNSEEQAKVTEAIAQLESLNIEIESKSSVVEEIKSFIDKNESVKAQYLETKGKLESFMSEYDTLKATNDKQLQDIKNEKEQLDSVKDYISEIYSKISNYISLRNERININSESAKDIIPKGLEEILNKISTKNVKDI